MDAGGVPAGHRVLHLDSDLGGRLPVKKIERDVARTREVVRRVAEDLTALQQRIAPPCARPEVRSRGGKFVAGLSQEALAERADVHRNHVAFLERGERSPTMDVLARIGEALGGPG